MSNRSERFALTETRKQREATRIGSDDFERDGTSRAFLLCTPHFAHAAATDWFEEFEVAKFHACDKRLSGAVGFGFGGGGEIRECACWMSVSRECGQQSFEHDRKSRIALCDFGKSICSLKSGRFTKQRKNLDRVVCEVRDVTNTCVGAFRVNFSIAMRG
jgi:ribosomal protein L37E